MPLKPIFDKAPLTPMTAQPLGAGLVRMDHAVMSKLYQMIADTNLPLAMEGAFRLACIVTAKPFEEPVVSKIHAYLDAQKADGSFPLSFIDSVAVLRAAWALYEYEARKPLLEHIARWCAYAVLNWDALMKDDAIWANSADLLELLENLYRVTGKAAVLALCERAATQTMGWSSVLNTISSQRPTNKTITPEELKTHLIEENGSREGYYSHFCRINHAEFLADGARSTMAKGWYSGSATELNATRIGWERLSRYHGAVCGGLTSDEFLEGTSPAAAVSTASLGAWAEALCTAAMGEKSGWAIDALERLAYNAMPACLKEESLAAFQRVNSLGADVSEKDCFLVHQSSVAPRALVRLVRGYAALASSCVMARADGACVNMYMPGRYAVPVGDSPMVLDITVSAKGASIKVHCRKATKAAVRLRMPHWSRNTEVLINGADCQADIRGGMISYDRIWNDGDVITLTFDVPLVVADGHHQGKYVMCGPVLMALPADDQWQKALVSAAYEDNHVVAVLDEVKAWKAKAMVPADIPVLPETENAPEKFQLMPYARTYARIALFPGRKQA